jgi:competence protein ComGC
MRKWILLLSIVAVLAALIIWKITFRKSDTSVHGKKADIEITATELLNAYETDEAGANEKYLNKIILVEGIIYEVQTDTNGTSVYLKEPDAMSGVLCGFNKETQITVTMHKGDNIKIKGVCTGYLMDVVLNKCSIE